MQTLTHHASRSISLRSLLKGIAADADLESVADLAIINISADSRQIAPDGLFVAVPGLKTHGLEYAVRAVQRGAVALCWEPTGNVSLPPLENVPTLAVPQLSAHVGELADRFYEEPSAALKIAAITGTNGKTTTAYILASACEKLGVHAGYMGTLGYGLIGSLQSSAQTTPDCITVHRQLAELCAEQVTAVGMEVSSHALDQGRIDAVRVDTAVFTNLSRDHLDYHDTMEAYGAAKARLFRWPGLRCRIINAGDAFGRKLLNETTGIRTLAYSIGRYAGAADAQVYAEHVRVTERGIELDLDGNWGAYTLHSPLLGAFNAENLLAALSVLLAWDVPLADAAAALEQIAAPAGRMELHAGNGRRAVIDYAHTPDALEKALRALRQHCCGKLICVFGCGGDRDRGKRPLMGEAADRLADRVILTDDNPRSEDPAKIVADIQTGMLRASEVSVEHDRAAAIHRALATCGSDDMVLVAGKGHEDYQIVGAEIRRFSDRDVVQRALRSAT